MSRFVRPDTATLTLANGDTLTVKRRLSAGDDRARRGMMAFVTLGDLALVVAYLLDWKLKDDDVKIRGLSTKDLVDVLDNLDAADYDEIHAAIEAHASAMKAERDAEKNVKAGTLSSGAISASVSVPDGLSTMFAG